MKNQVKEYELKLRKYEM